MMISSHGMKKNDPQGVIEWNQNIALSHAKKIQQKEKEQGKSQGTHIMTKVKYSSVTCLK